MKCGVCLNFTVKTVINTALSQTWCLLLSWRQCQVCDVISPAAMATLTHSDVCWAMLWDVTCFWYDACWWGVTALSAVLSGPLCGWIPRHFKAEGPSHKHPVFALTLFWKFWPEVVICIFWAFRMFVFSSLSAVSVCVFGGKYMFTAMFQTPLDFVDSEIRESLGYLFKKRADFKLWATCQVQSICESNLPAWQVRFWLLPFLLLLKGLSDTLFISS